MTDLPVEAVEAAARALCAITSDDESGWYCETHGTEIYVAGLYYCAAGEDDARAALTAAAPHIAAQAVGSDHWAHAAITAQDAALTAQINEAVKWGREKDAELTDLRAGVEALRDEWQGNAADHHVHAVSPDFTGTVNAVLGGMASSHADALNVLLRGAK